MKNRWLAFAPASMLAALAMLTWWLDQKVQPLTPAQVSSRNAPDFVVDDFEAVRMNLEGAPHHKVIARKLVHYAGDNSAILDQPQLFQYDEKGATSSIRSNKGTLLNHDNNVENVIFTGDVYVHRVATVDDPEMSLRTNELHVQPDQELVTTDQPVVVKSGNSTLHAVGLEFDNKKREMKFLSAVKGEFETPAKSKSLLWDRKR